MAKNRYGWNKRAKEMARKQKSEDKMKRRQGKMAVAPSEETPEAMEEIRETPGEGLAENEDMVHPE